MGFTTASGTAAVSIPSGGLGTAAWADPQYALVSDNNSAVAVLSAGSPTTEALRVTGFDFGAIPANAIIQGVAISVEARYNGLGSGAKLDWAELVLDGAALGDRDATDLVLEPTDSVQLYGAPDTRWGAAIDRETLADPSFGCQLGGARLSGSPSVRIDCVTLTVHWTTPCPPMQIGIGIGIGL